MLKRTPPEHLPRRRLRSRSPFNWRLVLIAALCVAAGVGAFILITGGQ